MNTLSSWEAQTKELLERVEKEITAIKADAEKRIAALEQRKWALEEALRAYREMMGSELVKSEQSLQPRDVEGKSHKEILRLIASQNNGLLIVRQAIRLMKEANVFGNPLHADSVVYSILNRSDDFKKVGKGVYKLNGHAQETKLIRPRRENSGLRETIKEFKEGNPNMTKAEVLQALIRKGFDFKGKRSGNAVNMAWVALGYAGKDAHQAPLISIEEAQQSV